MRIGHGFDIHRFQEGKPLVLGGVSISFNKGMEAHSDGDVLIHAVCDALIGAAALGDIGQHFPDTASEFKAANSRNLLTHVVQLLFDRGFSVSNIDTTIVAQVPKLAPYIDEMRTNLAVDLKIDKSCVSVKATTMEKLDAIGREEGIAVHAVVLIKSN